MISRSKACAPQVLTSITQEQFIDLEDSCTEAQHWATPPDTVKDLLSKFKSEVKGHFYVSQTRRCCYCSLELQRHKRTYDLEHVLSRRDYHQFIFEMKNMAAVCVICNGFKGFKNVLAFVPDEALAALPDNSDAYLIVHPQLDDWNDHLFFDEVGRVRAIKSSTKGRTTIEVCDIEKLNSIRLADYFEPASRVSAEQALQDFIGTEAPEVRAQALDLLNELASNSGLEAAKAIVACLKADLEQET